MDFLQLKIALGFAGVGSNVRTAPNLRRFVVVALPRTPCSATRQRRSSSLGNCILPRGDQERYEAQFQEICERAPHELDEPQNLGDDVLDDLSGFGDGLPST